MQPRFEDVFPVLYKGWDPTSARQDFNNGNWTNKAGAKQFMPGYNPQEEVNSVIEDSFRRLQEEMSNKYNAYKSSNPFNLDQILAQKTQEAKEQIDPYYNETLGNYLTGVTRKMERSTSDTRDLLGQLNADTDAYTEGAKLKLTEAINKSQEGKTDTGMFNSGEKFRDQGLLQAGASTDLNQFNQGQDNRAKQATTGLDRTLEDLTSAKTQDVRNIERERYSAVQGRAGDLTKEAGQQWTAGFKATLPPELQAQSGFDILKDIGIYS